MRSSPALRSDGRYTVLVGVGGVGTGMVLELEGDRTLGRNESRAARLLDVRDYCKLHIVAHYAAVLLAARPEGAPFRVVPVARIGRDEAGRRLLGELAAAGIDTTYVETVPGRPTLFSVCLLYANGEGGNITTSDSAASALSPADVDAVRPLLASAGRRAIALAMPEAPLDARRRLLELGTDAGALRVASFASEEVAEATASGMLSLVDLVALNEDEAAAATGIGFDTADPSPFLDACARTLSAARPGVRIVVSAGADGAFAFEDGRWLARRSLPVEVAGTAGAGDALLAGILAGLAAGAPLAGEAGDDGSATCALDLGVLLAGRSVTSPHTIDPDANAGTLRALAEDLGVRIAGPLAEVL